MCVPRKVDKEKVDQATQIIESCWDENNPEDDNRTFDERLTEAIKNCEDEELKKILGFAAPELK